MYPRRLAAPERSFFLFGPRGTGKTTWLRQTFPDALWFDLVRDEDTRALAGLVDGGIVGRAYAVYEGTALLRSGAVEVLPVGTFLERLYAGRIIG